MLLTEDSKLGSDMFYLEVTFRNIAGKA